MSQKNWVITSAAERIALDGQKKGEAAFTVTNAGPRDTAVFEVVPMEGAEPSWFTVDSPQRTVGSRESVSYLVKVAIPPTAKPGSYAMKGRVYSADPNENVAPEESSVDSGRVVLEVQSVPAPVKKPFPWWIVIVAALVVITVAVVTIVLVASDDKPGPTAPGEVATAPDLIGKSEADAAKALAAAGLKVGKVSHRQDPAKTGVADQSVKAGSRVFRDSTVDFTLFVQLTAPALKSPGPATILNGAAQAVNLTWEQSEPWVTKWRVVMTMEVCTATALTSPLSCNYFTSANTGVDAKTFLAKMQFTFRPSQGTLGNYHSGMSRWEITPIDDFGNAGPNTTWTFQVRP